MSAAKWAQDAREGIRQAAGSNSGDVEDFCFDGLALWGIDGWFVRIYSWFGGKSR